jgi:hypothetical protein
MSIKNLAVIALMAGTVLVLAWAAGAGWFDDERLSVDSDISFTSPANTRNVAVGPGGIAHVVWTDYRLPDAGSPHVYYKRFDGVTWTADERIVTTPSYYPSVTTDGTGHVHVVWTDARNGNTDIYYKMFDEVSWSSDVQLTTDLSAAIYPSVAVDDTGHIHVVWEDRRDDDQEIYYKHYDGSTWGPDTRLTNSLGLSTEPSVAVGDSGRVHVVWHDYRDGNYEIYHKLFDGSWGGDERLTADPGKSWRPSLAVDTNGKAHLAWEDNRVGSAGIYYAKHDGTAWSTETLLTSDVGPSYTPSLAAASGGRLDVVWHTSPGESSDIHFKIFNGTTWSNSIRLTHDPGQSTYPSLPIRADSVVYLVWQDDRTGQYEVYWKSFPNALPPKPEIYSIEPDSAFRYNAVHITDLAGNHFESSAQVWLRKAGEPRIYATNTTLVSPGHLTCDFDLTAIDSGSCDVVVNIRGMRDTLVSGLRVVIQPIPEIVSIQPSGGPSDESVYISNLAGANFGSATQVYIVKTGEPTIYATNLVAVSSTKITCDLPLEDAEVGLWDVVVENADGRKDTLHSGFTVLSRIWEDEVRLTNDPGASSTSKPNARCIAVDGSDNLHVVWHDDREGTAFPVIYYKTYDGVSWSSDLRIDESSDVAAYPSIAVDTSDRLHVVWHDHRYGDAEIHYKLFDGAWGSDVRLTSSPYNSSWPSIATKGNELHVVWEDYRMGNYEIYHKHYDGVSWESDERLTISLENSILPSVAVDVYGMVHVVWLEAEADIYHTAFNGIEWSPMAAIDGAPTAEGAPAICADPFGGVHITWHATPAGQVYPDIYYRHYDGLVWHPVEKLTNYSGWSHNTSVVADADGNVHVFWADASSGHDEIRYGWFDGTRWRADVGVSHPDDESSRPFGAVDSEGRLHVVWRDRRHGAYEIYYRMHDIDHISGIDEPAVGLQPGVLRIVPNPIQNSAQVSFSIAAKALTRVAIYDIAGRLVWENNLGIREPGPHQVMWDRRDVRGRAVASGVYLVKIEAGTRRHSGKIVVVR